jgi:hypothetical protein
MKWMLMIVALGTTPIQTNLMYDSLDACYAAEDKIAAEGTGFKAQSVYWHNSQ